MFQGHIFELKVQTKGKLNRKLFLLFCGSKLFCGASNIVLLYWYELDKIEPEGLNLVAKNKVTRFLLIYQSNMDKCIF